MRNYEESSSTSSLTVPFSLTVPCVPVEAEEEQEVAEAEERERSSSPVVVVDTRGRGDGPSTEEDGEQSSARVWPSLEREKKYIVDVALLDILIIL